MAGEEQAAGGLASIVPGEGNIRQRTIRFGPVILAVESIDTVALTVRPRNVGLIIMGSVLIGVAIAALVHGINLDYIVTAIVFLIIVGIGVAVAFRWPSKSVLAVGTGGGRTYYVTSGNRDFLIRLGELIRRKIDEGDPQLSADFSAESGEIVVAAERLRREPR